MTGRLIALEMVGVIFFAVTAYAQESDIQLTITQILQKADSVSKYQDTLRQNTRFKMEEAFVFHELDEESKIKDADTVITVLTMEGDREISREMKYFTKQPGGEKKSEEGKKEISFSYSNPDYNYSLTGTDDTNYIIAVSPKRSPEKGDIEGIVKVDKNSFETRVLEFRTLKPDGALKEFATSMSFEPMEGGLLVLREMRMKGFAKAFLGIFKMRFSGEVKYSNYELIK